MVWPAPQSRSSGGRSAVSTISGTRVEHIDHRRRGFATAVPTCTRSRPACATRAPGPSAKKPPERSSTCDQAQPRARPAQTPPTAPSGCPATHRRRAHAGARELVDQRRRERSTVRDRRALARHIASGASRSVTTRASAERADISASAARAAWRLQLEDGFPRLGLQREPRTTSPAPACRIARFRSATAQCGSRRRARQAAVVRQAASQATTVPAARRRPRARAPGARRGVARHPNRRCQVQHAGHVQQTDVAAQALPGSAASHRCCTTAVRGTRRNEPSSARQSGRSRAAVVHHAACSARSLTLARSPRSCSTVFARALATLGTACDRHRCAAGHRRRAPAAPRRADRREHRPASARTTQPDAP